MDMKPFITFLVFIVLPFFNVCLKIDIDGVSINYSVTLFSNCGQTDVDKLRYLNVKLSDCVTGCGLGQNCKALTFMRKMQMCDLLSSEMDLDNMTAFPCMYVSKKDIDVKKTPCGVCNDGKECDVKTKTCIHKACPIMSIENGFVFGKMRRVGDKIRFKCSYGYEDVKGSKFAVCQENGQWNATANCTKIECKHPGYLENGQFVLDPNTVPQTVAAVTCNDGYLPSSVNITCDELGIWQTVSCKPRSCGMPQNLQDGRIYLNNGIIYQSTATVVCSMGFMASSNIIRCTSSGDWESVTCDRISCGVPSITNGQITAGNGYKYEDTATVTCDAGYAESTTMVSCLATGKWKSATCDPLVCGKPGVLQNGRIFSVTGTVYPSVASFTCYAGYSPSSATITCNTLGNWDVVTCDRISCGAVPSIAKGQITASNGDKYQDTATATCDTGYQAKKSTVTCLATGSWSATECQPKVCGSPPNVTYGQMTEISGVTYLSTARVVCDTHYEPSTEYITCTASGDWDATSCTDCYINEPIKFAGTKNTTLNGLSCIQWDLFGSIHYVRDENFPDGSVSAAGNLCRSPDDYGSVWCFYDTDHSWDNCDVPMCS